MGKAGEGMERERRGLWGFLVSSSWHGDKRAQDQRLLSLSLALEGPSHTREISELILLSIEYFAKHICLSHVLVVGMLTSCQFSHEAYIEC